MDNIVTDFELDYYHDTWDGFVLTEEKTAEQKFGERFREACERSGHNKLTQINLGKLIDVSGPVVNHYRNGKLLPAMKTAIKICNLTGTSLNWLMLGKGKPDDSFSLEEVWMSYPEEERIAFLANLASRHSK